jgi:hypothetical protein
MEDTRRLPSASSVREPYTISFVGVKSLASNCKPYYDMRPAIVRAYRRCCERYTIAARM